MAGWTVLLFSGSKLDYEEVFEACEQFSGDSETDKDVLFNVRDPIAFYFHDENYPVHWKVYAPDTSKHIFYMQLKDLWQQRDFEIKANLSCYAYITVEGEYVEQFSDDSTKITNQIEVAVAYKKFEEKLMSYAQSLPETTWIARLDVKG